jgi:DNA-binding response OmpR family regulator
MAKTERAPIEVLAGLLVLIVEDEMLLAFALEDLVHALGCVVVKAARLRKGLELARTAALDGAILDINLAGEEVFPVARELRRRSIPFLFSSGYGEAAVPEEFRDSPMLPKPFEPGDLGPLMVKTFAPAAA